MQFWAYSHGGVLSHDGTYQFSSVDRHRFMFRKGSEICFVPCEHWTSAEGKAMVACYLSQPIEYQGAAGTRTITDEERAEMKTLLPQMLPLVGSNASIE